MEVKTISIKYLGKDDIQSGKKYVVGLQKVCSNMNATVKAYFGQEMQYSYYKTKGYFGLIGTLFDKVLDNYDTYSISDISGDDLKAHWDNVVSSGHKFAVVENSQFDSYIDFLYNDRDKQETSKEYHEQWDYTCHEKQPEKIFGGQSDAFTLPRHIARSLKSDRDWAMAKRVRINWQQLVNDGIMADTLVHNA